MNRLSIYLPGWQKHQLVYITLAWIIILYAFVWLLPQQQYFPFSYEDEVVHTEVPRPVWHLANFDGVHYQNISHAGYIARFQAAFFPLYPTLIALLGFILRNHLLAALSISSISLLLSAWLWQHLNYSKNAWLLYLSFPLSFFLVSAYTESLFLALALASTYSFQRNKYWKTGLFGALASATRIYGLFLLPLLVLDKLNWKKVSKQLIAWGPLVLMPAGLLIYMSFLWWQTGDPLRFVHALTLWQKSETTFPLQTVWRYLKIFATVSPRLWIFWVALLEFASLVFASVGCYWLLRKRAWGQAIYLGLGLLLPLLTGTLQSLPRYLLVLFPLFIITSDKLPKPVFRLVFTLGLVLQLTLFAAFLNGLFVA